MTKTFHRLTLISLALAASVQLAACGGGSAGAPDIFPPTVLITSQAADSGDVIFTFTFNEDVGDSFTASDIQITGGSLVSLTRVSLTVYSAVVKPDSASTALLVNVAAESFADEAGNLNLSNPSAVFDPTAPSLTITDNVSAATATGDVVFTFSFNKAVSGFTVDDVTVAPEGAQKADFVMAADNKSATLRVTPPANSTGTLEVSVAPGTFTDFSDNANVAPFMASQAFDTTGETSPSNNLLANGDFEDGETGWIGEALDVRTEGGNSFFFADLKTAGEAYAVNISYPLNIPTEGVKYKLSFKASSNTNRVLRAGIGLNQAPWTNVSEDVNLTTTPQTFTLELTSNFANANSRVLFDMGQAVGHVVIDDVVLELVEESGNGDGAVPLTYASNYTGDAAQNPTSWRSTEGGDAGRYAAAGAPVWWSGTASGDATPSLYFGFGLLPEDWGFGAYVNAPNNGTVNVSGYSNVQFSVWGNDELVNQNPRPNFSLIMQAPAVAGECIPEVQKEFQVTGAGVQTYTIALSGMAMRQDCGQPTLNTPAAILASGVKSIHVQVTNANLNKTLNAGDGRYPNGLNIGPISFN